MPDITMCGNEECEKKETCYRYVAKPDVNQRYFAGCENYEMYWEVKREEI